MFSRQVFLTALRTRDSSLVAEEAKVALADINSMVPVALPARAPLEDSQIQAIAGRMQLLFDEWSDGLCGMTPLEVPRAATDKEEILNLQLIIEARLDGAAAALVHVANERLLMEIGVENGQLLEGHGPAFAALRKQWQC